jgi:hypothetical protein
MRSEILRDLIAGCTGALAVAMLIGLPGKTPAGQQTRLQFGPVELLPYFRPMNPAVPAPPAPHTKITTGR